MLLLNTMARIPHVPEDQGQARRNPSIKSAAHAARIVEGAAYPSMTPRLAV